MDFYFQLVYHTFLVLVMSVMSGIQDRYNTGLQPSLVGMCNLTYHLWLHLDIISKITRWKSYPFIQNFHAWKGKWNKHSIISVLVCLQGERRSRGGGTGPSNQDHAHQPKCEELGKGVLWIDQRCQGQEVARERTSASAHQDTENHYPKDTLWRGFKDMG